MHGNVPVRFGRGRLDSLDNKGLAAYLIARSWLPQSLQTSSERRARNGGSRSAPLTAAVGAAKMPFLLCPRRETANV